MSTRRNFLAGSGLAVLGLLSGCGSSDPVAFPSSTPYTLPNPALLARQLEQDVQLIQDAAHAPGVAAGIWTPAGSWVQAFGRSRVNPDRQLQLGDAFAWRSVTKSFTVTLILQLVRDGRLGLDDTVDQFVPGLPAGERITLRHLAGMTSGLTDYVRSERFFESVQDLEQFLSVEQLIDFTRSEPLRFQPGTQYEYCNSNTLILGRVVEVVTGTSFETALRARILEPLQMRNTEYFEGVDLPEPSTRGYTFDNGAFSEARINFSLLGPAGAMAGPIGDARIWAPVLASGSLIGPELQAQRKRGRPATNGPIYDRYGLGMGEIQGWYGHTGEGVGYAVAMFAEPQTGGTIIILMNSSNEHDMPARLLRRFLATLGWPIPTPPDARP